MFKISDRSTPTCIVIQVEGAISSDDYDDFTDAFEKAVEEHGRVNLVIELLGSVKYADKDAFKDDWEFGVKEYRKARRAAFVGDQKLLKGMMRAFSPLTRTSERFFSGDELDAAIEWASAPE